MFIIKRYNNRKYYNCTLKQYTNLKEILLLLQVGNPIQVLDQQTGEDITAKTIAKIISRMPAQHLQRMNHLLSPLSEEKTQVFSEPSETLKIQQGNEAKLLFLKSQPTFKEPVSISAFIAYVIGYLNLPSKEQLNRLNDQIDELNKKVDILFSSKKE